MAGTFTQIYIQAVFAVKGPSHLLQKPWRDEVFKYMADIIKNKGQKPIIINRVADHAHLFFALKPSIREAYLEFLKKFQIAHEDRFLFE